MTVPTSAQTAGNSTGSGTLNFLLRLIWFIGSGIGLNISLKITKAFRNGKLAIPWVLFTTAFGILALGSLAALAEFFKLPDGFSLVSRIVFTLGVLTFLAAGYFYKKAVLR